jgi:hypothetical protein
MDLALGQMKFSSLGLDFVAKELEAIPGHERSASCVDVTPRPVVSGFGGPHNLCQRNRLRKRIKSRKKMPQVDLTFRDMAWKLSKVPRQKFVGAVDGMVGDRFEHMTEIEFRVDTVQLG